MPSSTAVSAAPCDSPAVSHRNTGPSFHVADASSGDHGRRRAPATPRRAAAGRTGRGAHHRASTRTSTPTAASTGAAASPAQDAAARGAPSAGASLTSPAPSAPGAARCTAANAPPRTTAPSSPRHEVPGAERDQGGEREHRARHRDGVREAPGDEVGGAAGDDEHAEDQPRREPRRGHETGGDDPRRHGPEHRQRPGARQDRDEHPAPHPREQGPHAPPPRARPPTRQRGPRDDRCEDRSDDHAVEPGGSPFTRRHALASGPVDASGRWGRRTEQRAGSRPVAALRTLRFPRHLARQEVRCRRDGGFPDV